ncbi:hypothetical protein [Roseicitreum antarcticum]|nr:hypothetical protein [Roseicitreum antarcticum]
MPPATKPAFTHPVCNLTPEQAAQAAAALMARRSAAQHNQEPRK